jgi:hypothetical protein
MVVQRGETRVTTPMSVCIYPKNILILIARNAPINGETIPDAKKFTSTALSIPRPRFVRAGPSTVMTMHEACGNPFVLWYFLPLPQ